jgi:hypothetical protein
MEANTRHLAGLVTAPKPAVISTLMLNRLHVWLIAAPIELLLMESTDAPGGRLISAVAPV